jgi:hypothetical protein
MRHAFGNANGDAWDSDCDSYGRNPNADTDVLSGRIRTANDTLRLE